MRRFSQGAGREAGDGQTFICTAASEKSNETSIIFWKPGVVAGIGTVLCFATASLLQRVKKNMKRLWKYIPSCVILALHDQFQDWEKS